MSKHQPKGFHILHEDLDLIIGNKKAGFITVAALWNKDDTIHDAVNDYIRKGNARSSKCVYVVHRLDQATTGVLVFAKSEQAQQYLKNNWKNFTKTYLTVVHGHLEKKSGLIESFLAEDEEYFVSSTKDEKSGKLARTEYSVLAENKNFSLLKINLLTGKKNQIRVHLSELGHPVVGDPKYGKKPGQKNLALHAYSLALTHPHKKTELVVRAPVPEIFKQLISFDYPGLE